MATAGRRQTDRKEACNMRKCGILLPISSLPSAYGIGSFSKEAYEFVDFLAAAGQYYWQVLPLGPTGYGDSPYQSFSTFAGNPYFIDLEKLIEYGWLKREECDVVDFGHNREKIIYEKIYRGRFKLLKKAFQRSGCADVQIMQMPEKEGAASPNGSRSLSAAMADQETEDGRIRDHKEEYRKFAEKNHFWLDDYALFMALKTKHQGRGYMTWPEDIRLHKTAAVRKYRVDPEYQEEIAFQKFMQYLFFYQWFELKQYANRKGVHIIGDIPIYVALDSADTWANPEMFLLDEKHVPIAVAGCPPDYFSKTGQLWGNPLYRWDYHKETGYAWWMWRLEQCFSMYDVVRIDHFRGFDEYYHIPYGDKTAEFGHWVKGPGYDFFQTMKKKLGKHPIIAEDLGFLTPGVKRLVKKTGYPGMKILEFAFDSNEDNDYLPHNYDKNCVVYTGTHDNDTTLGWFRSLKKADKAYARKYLNNGSPAKINWDMIRLALASVADTAVIPMQDYLSLGSEGRINTPSTLGNNWDWRMREDVYTAALAEKIYEMAKLYKRVDD